MKYLLLLVVFANVLLFTWFVAFKQAGLDSVDKASSLIEESSREREVDSITLLSEVKGSPDITPDIVTLENNSLVHKLLGSRCLTIGAFTNSDGAFGVLSYLSSIGLNGLIRKEKGVSRRGYWVFIPPYPSRARARVKLKELQSDGFDSFIVTKGVNRNAISLGIFKHKNEAKQHLADLEGKIGDIELGSRVRTKTKYWLDVEHHLRELVPENVLNKLLLEGFSEMDIVSRDC